MKNQNNMNKKIIGGGIALVVAIGLFFGGMKYGQAHAQTTGQMGRGQFSGQMAGAFGNRRGMQNGGANGGFVIGDILAKDDKSITISLPTGGSKIVFTSGSTQVMKTTAGSLADLVVGQSVSVQGSANSDGSVTAQAIQLRPAGFMRGSTTSQTAR
jgi:hypothetical protein